MRSAVRSTKRKAVPTRQAGVGKRPRRVLVEVIEDSISQDDNSKSSDATLVVKLLNARTENRLRVYCAHAISCNRDSEHNYTEYGVEPDREDEMDSFIYTGPFTIGCDHGCFHGFGSHGCGVEQSVKSRGAGCAGKGIKPETVVDACLKQVARSDVLFATLSKEGQHGTVAEISSAVQMGKPVFIYAEEDAAFNLKEYWFVITMALSTLPKGSKLTPTQFQSFQPHWKTIDEYMAYWHRLRKARPPKRNTPQTQV